MIGTGSGSTPQSIHRRASDHSTANSTGNSGALTLSAPLQAGALAWLAVVSVPGEYASLEAHHALTAGLHGGPRRWRLCWWTSGRRTG